MAQATRIRFGSQQLLVGSGGPVVYTAPCGITSLTRQITTNTSDVDIPDCADPDAFTWLGIDVNSKRMTLTFSGLLAIESLPLWDEWSTEEGSKPIRWYRGIGGALQGHWSGDGVLTEYQEQSENRGSYQISGTIVWDGAPVWTAVP